jgi:hypothetical protein
MAPQFVKPYVKTNKNDAADAEAICEAVTRPKDANTRLLEIDIATADPSTYSAINAQLDSVIARATKLKEEVANASSTSTRSSAGGRSAAGSDRCNGSNTGCCNTDPGCGKHRTSRDQIATS